MELWLLNWCKHYFYPSYEQYIRNIELYFVWKRITIKKRRIFLKLKNSMICELWFFSFAYKRSFIGKHFQITLTIRIDNWTTRWGRVNLSGGKYCCIYNDFDQDRKIVLADCYQRSPGCEKRFSNPDFKGSVFSKVLRFHGWSINGVESNAAAICVSGWKSQGFINPRIFLMNILSKCGPYVPWLRSMSYFIIITRNKFCPDFWTVLSYFKEKASIY